MKTTSISIKFSDEEITFTATPLNDKNTQYNIDYEKGISFVISVNPKQGYHQEGESHVDKEFLLHVVNKMLELDHKFIVEANKDQVEITPAINILNDKMLIIYKFSTPNNCIIVYEPNSGYKNKTLDCEAEDFKDWIELVTVGINSFENQA